MGCQRWSSLAASGVTVDDAVRPWADPRVSRKQPYDPA